MSTEIRTIVEGIVTVGSATPVRPHMDVQLRRQLIHLASNKLGYVREWLSGARLRPKKCGRAERPNAVQESAVALEREVRVRSCVRNGTLRSCVVQVKYYAAAY